MSGRTGRGTGQRLRIAQVAPPLEAVPPSGYGGTARIVGELVQELDRRGHQATPFASGAMEPEPLRAATAAREQGLRLDGGLGCWASRARARQA
jgi:hypothetical protein